jgi:hypothetical protein
MTVPVRLSRGLMRRLRCVASGQISQVEFQMAKETNLRVEAENKNMALVEEHEEAVQKLIAQLKEKDNKLEHATANVRYRPRVPGGVSRPASRAGSSQQLPGSACGFRERFICSLIKSGEGCDV